ncbi:MAG TPA: PD-(D/E)XK nuclease family protein [Vicinamibacteria bacterium]|nr:PD-(D/E)XK nuclease family protein [Vicinamibacteria bacterium]
MHPLVLLVPPYASAEELPRRLASTGRPLAAVYAMEPLELARAIAEPLLLARGLRPWRGQHSALLAARLLAAEGGGLPLPGDAPRAPVVAALTRTLVALRHGSVPPEAVERLATGEARSSEDARRLRALGGMYRRFHHELEGQAADPVALYAAAREALRAARWLAGAWVVIPEDLELEPVAEEFVTALAAALPTVILRRPLPPSLRPASFRGRVASRGIGEADWSATRLAPLAPPPPPASLLRLRESLFEPLSGSEVDDDAVELLTAGGEAAEARAVARRLLRQAARGVPFEEMGVVLARPDPYAPLFADLLTRLGVPYRLHPSLPLRFGRAARSLLLLFRCRGLERQAVMELLTFAPVPFAAMLGEEGRAWPARWDRLSREAGIVSDYSRWMVGLRAYTEAEREAADAEADPYRRERRLRNAGEAEDLLRVVEALSNTLESLSGEASWPEWVHRLQVACEDWIGPEHDRERVLEVIADLGGLGSVASRASADEVEQVIEERFEQKRVPLLPQEGGAVHVGALDAMAGLPFRVVAIPGLVEGGYPGVFRPDPFLLDEERQALGVALAPRPAPARPGARRGGAQLELFAPTAAASALPRLPTSQDRLAQARRVFHRALSQASERLILSYPRADARTGRERLPSLFFAAAASTLAGRPLSAAELERRVSEDALEALALEDAVDPGERDRLRLRRDEGAAAAVAAGSACFRQSRLATRARWSGRLTRYDGLLELEPELAARLDPLGERPASASRLAVYAQCGFQYLLKEVLRLQVAPEPEERRRLEPLERGNLFHEVAERFLRERRDRGELPLRDNDSNRARLREMAEEALDQLVRGSPPRFTLLWEREKRRFQQTTLEWFAREVAAGSRSLPLHFEVSFGLGRTPQAGEPHSPEPLEIDLGEGRVLRVCGKIDRIDRRHEGGLVLRDYKTGRAPKDDGGVFRGGRQLQIPFYLRAAAKLLPGEPVVDAFLDYVDGGRQVAFRPELATGEAFRNLLRELVSLVSRGVFPQEPLACDWCDFTAVCGPKPLLQRRQAIKVRDAALQDYLRLRDVG